ncbi:hypothetical protein ACFE04_000304 [Oxalis oulophora]
MKNCFNSECKELKGEQPRNGWKLRNTTDFAPLCDRCASAFEEGRFCDVFHSKASGWRHCESCAKRIHCGCIASNHTFTLLDAGGIECMTCARKHLVLASPSWPPSLFNNVPVTLSMDRLRELSTKNCLSQLAGSGPVPWRQAPSLFNSSISQSELNPQTSCEIEGFIGTDRANVSDKQSVSILEKMQMLMNASPRLGGMDLLRNGDAGVSGQERPDSSSNTSHLPSSVREDPSIPQFGLIPPYASLKETNAKIGFSGTQFCQTSLPLPAKHFHGNTHSRLDSSSEPQMRNGKHRVDARGKGQFVPRYWPRFTNQELQQITGNSNSIITPLFEKMLSASDAGRIGRLVLPKKCAEAYFPPIYTADGLPLKVLDTKGKEWIFQFRFWPNNNSRMYVLEGVMPCIQDMHLQAGDIVTFSRLEPEGKLIMGFRRASTTSASEQEKDTSKAGNGIPTRIDAEPADPSSLSEVDKSNYIAKELIGPNSTGSRKRKYSTLGSKSKRLRFENEDMIELKLTWEEAQGLLRPPIEHLPSVVVVEGFEFEEFEDAPILGKPTFFATDNQGNKIQWVQCEDCLKWRKVPGDTLLPSKWTCSGNSWDQERYNIPKFLLSDMMTLELPPSKKMKAAKHELDNVEALEGLDTLANLAILGEATTTKHPRHRPGCLCIVCIQPPSGKGHKHKHTCMCNVCSTVKRRFQTLMSRRAKKQSEKESKTTRKKLSLKEEDHLKTINAGNTSPLPDDKGKSANTSPYKGQIDLNMQPERDDELSPGSDCGNMIRLLHDASDKLIKQQKLVTSCSEKSPSGSQTPPVVVEMQSEKLINGAMLYDAGDVERAASLLFKSSEMTISQQTPL